MKTIRDVFKGFAWSLAFYGTLSRLFLVVEKNLIWTKSQGIFGVYLVLLHALTIGLVYSIVMSHLTPAIEVSVPRKSPRFRRFRWLNIAIPVILLIAFSVLWFTVRTDFLAITYPRDGDSVSMSEDIKGDSENLPTDKMIWILIYSYQDNRYYPHTSNADAELRGHWTSRRTVIGAQGDQGRQFDIIALLVDQQARQELESYLVSAERAGMARIPLGSEIHQKMTVIRK